MTKHTTRTRTAALITATTIALTGCTVGGGDTPDPSTPPASQFDTAGDLVVHTDMNGQMVDQSMTDADVQADPAEIRQISDSGDLFTIQSAGLVTPLGTMVSKDGVIEPVNYTSVFVVSDYSPGYGAPADGPMVLVGHALDGVGRGPGNFVVDEGGQFATSEGDLISVGGVDYEIVSQELVLKSELPDRGDVWEAGAGMLQFVTCVPHSDRNAIITAAYAGKE